MSFKCFYEELNSNTDLKLFILVWSDEGMEGMNLAYEKSYEKFSTTQIFEIFIIFSSCNSDKVTFSVS